MTLKSATKLLNKNFLGTENRKENILIDGKANLLHVENKGNDRENTLQQKSRFA